MATAKSIDDAEWTFTDDLFNARNDQGGYVQVRNENPWAFVRFTDEAQRYVVPINGTTVAAQNPLSSAATGLFSWRNALVEVMPFAPFPNELARPPRSNDSRDSNNAGGTWAVHFFGWL